MRLRITIKRLYIYIYILKVEGIRRTINLWTWSRIAVGNVNLFV
jgi:hypothetical protein